MRDGHVPSRMRAAVITAPRTCELIEVATPEIDSGDVLIRVEGCGVCGSNLPIWEGRDWFHYPLPPGRPGHEGWGRVAAIGPDVHRVAVGDRVAFLSEHAFAEYDVAPETAVVHLPAALDGRDMPGEPLGCALNIWRRSVVERTQTVAVIGVGFLGCVLIQLAARADARVIAISRRPYSLELARMMGAAECIDFTADDAAIVARVEALTGGTRCDRVIELVGLQRPLDLAAKLCRVRGRLVIAGLHQDGPRQVDMRLWNWRGLDVVNAHEREPTAYLHGIANALDRIVSGWLVPDPLYTHHLPLARAGEAFELLRRRPDGFVKAMVLP